MARKGKAIYLQGVSPDGGEIVALMGDDAIEVPAAALPCASCHGFDGRGRPEGGVSPSDLTWSSLTRPYEGQGPSGRRHPPYDLSKLRRAITLGVDPAGNELHVAMPRYRMARTDLNALVAYLQHLEGDRDPGISDGSLRLGVLLPPPGPLAPMRQTLRRVLETSRDRVNAEGGIFGRALDLRFLDLPADPAEHVGAVASFLADEEIFALAPSFFAGRDEALAALAEERGLPVVAPFTLNAVEAFPLNRQVFYLWPGLAAQGKILARFAASGVPALSEGGAGGPSETLIVMASPDERLEAAAAAALEEAQGLGVAARRQLWTEGLPVDLDSTDALLFFAPDGEVRSLLGGREGLAARVFLPGTLAGRAVLETAGDRVYLIYPTLPGDLSEPAATTLAELARSAEVPSGQGSTLLAAHLGFELLSKGLEEAGRELSREGLIEALEGIYGWSTGFGQPLSFGPNRRIGVYGAYGARVDPASGGLTPVGPWIAGN